MPVLDEVGAQKREEHVAASEENRAHLEKEKEEQAETERRRR